MSSIPPDSPWRGAAAFLPQPLNEPNDQLAAQFMVEHLYYFNVRLLTTPLADIVYRSSDGDSDICRHVYRWDTAPYDFVFQHGFTPRRMANTPDETYYNLEQYVNSGGTPLDTRRDTTYCFISTTINSGWNPSVSSGDVPVYVYRYEICAPGGIWVDETLEERYAYPGQQEIAFPAGIAPQYIRSAQLFKLTRDGRYTRRTRVDEILHINTNFNPQSHPQRNIPIKRPVSNYKDENNEMKKLKIEEFPQREKREVATSNADIIEYYIEGVTTISTYLDSAFRSTETNEAYLFFQNEYVRLNYAPGSTNDQVVNGPLYISDGFPSLVGTPFAEYGIDAAFGCHDGDESFIFSGSICAKIKYAPGTTNDKILEGPKTIRQMFTNFKGTNFEKGVDAAFESSVPNEVYIFKGEEYARVDYIQRKTIAIYPIVEGFPCLRNANFESDIGAAFASHKPNEAYMFKGNSYVLLHFTPGEPNDYIIGGPKEIVPNNWPSLANILPRDNAGLDIYEGPRAESDHVHDEL